MAISADRVIVELEAKIANYEANVARAEAKFDKAMGGIQKSAGQTEKFITRSVSAMGAALSGISVLALARGFLSLADQAKNLDAQLRLATAASGSFAQAQDDVRRIAAETRTGIAETAELYATFMRNSRELGITQEQAARSTETITKAFQISGATAAEAAGGLRQFLQGIQSGTLRGEELNSVLENAPRLARALADGLGITIGQLRAMGQEGELTGEKVVGALTSASDQIDAEFSELPVTFDQAMTLVYNSAVTTFGEFDRGGQFSTALANFVTDGAAGFEDLGEAAFDLGVDIRSTFEGLSDAFEPLVTAALNAFGTIGQEARTQAQQMSKLLGQIDAVTAWSASQEGGIETLINAKLWGRGPGGTNFQKRFDEAQKASDRQLRRSAGEQRLRDSLRGRDVMGNPLGGGGVSRGGSGGGGGAKASRRGGGGTSRSPLDADAFAREEAHLNDEILKLKAEEAGNAEERALAEMKRLEAAHLAAVNDVQADKRYTEAQKRQIVALLGTANALEQAKVLAERDIAAAREALDIRVAGMRNQQDLLRVEADNADTRAERRDIELRLLDLAYEMEKAELEALIASKEATATQKQIAQQRLNILGALQQGETEGVGKRFESPMERYRREVGDVGKNINDELEQVQVDGLQSLNDGLTDVIMGAKSLGDVFKQVTNQIIADLIRIAIQQAIIAPLMQALGGGMGGGMGGGGGGGIGASLGAAVGAGLESLIGFSGGGSMKLAGRGGTDTNTLSLNGRPIANVSRGETLNVGSKALGGRGGGTTVISSPQFDLRGAVMTRELYADMQRIARANASEAGGVSYKQSMRDAPSAVARRQRYGA